MANKNIRSLSSRKGLEDNLFERIADLSGKNANEEDFHELSKQFMIDDSVVFGTASFYDFIKNLIRSGHRIISIFPDSDPGFSCLRQ